MLAISYTRFSSTKQSRGDSFRRQTQLASQWCEENGLTLDTTPHFHDAGKSGWSGENVRTGALSQLLAKVQKGEIPRGTVLLIEDLDRLTRMGLPVAVPLLLSILASGLDIVTLQDRKRWTHAGMKDMSEFVMSVMLLARGHNESERKSVLVRKAFQANRDKQSRQIFGSAPGWLTRTDKTKKWKVVPAHAKVVRRVFELSAAGWGSIQIARKATAENWPVPTRTTTQKRTVWHSRLAGHLLRSRQVLGEHTYRLRGYEETEAHWRGRSTGITIADFYPRIVSDELWHRAQAAIATRRSAPARRDAQYFNIWSGRMFCGNCGASMFRRTELRSESKSERKLKQNLEVKQQKQDSKPVSGIFKCSEAAVGRGTCKSCAIKPVDRTLLREVCALASSYMPSSAGQDHSEALAIAKSRLAEIDAAAERVAIALAETGDALPALITKSKELALSRSALAANVTDLESKLVAGAGDMLDTAYADSVLAILYKRGTDAAAIRAEFNARLRQAVRAIWLFPYDCAVVAFAGGIKPLVVPLAPKGKVIEGQRLPIGEKFRQFTRVGASNLPAPRYFNPKDVRAASEDLREHTEAKKG